MYVGVLHESTYFLGSNVTHLCWKINSGRKCASSIDSRHTFMFEIKCGHTCTCMYRCSTAKVHRESMAVVNLY